MTHLFLTRKILIILSLCTLSATLTNPAIADPGLNFSRSPLKIHSPDGVYILQSVASSSDRNLDLLYVEKPDELVLMNSGDSKARSIRKYHRNVDVFWGPDSKAFIVNDWQTNSYGDAFLYKLDALNKPISLRQRLLSSGISSEERKLIANKDHSYLFVNQWKESENLLVKASGHYSLPGKPVSSYTLYYLLDLKSNKWKLLKKESNENLERDVPNMSQFGA